LRERARRAIRDRLDTGVAGLKRSAANISIATTSSAMMM
jgi:hypothetical protein